MKRFALMVAALALVSFVPRAGWAQAPVEKAWNDVSRFSLAVGVNYDGYRASPGGLEVAVPKEFEFGPFAGWDVTQHLKLVGGTAYGVDSKAFRSWVGLRWQMIGAE